MYHVKLLDLTDVPYVAKSLYQTENEHTYITSGIYVLHVSVHKMKLVGSYQIVTRNEIQIKAYY